MRTAAFRCGESRFHADTLWDIATLFALRAPGATTTRIAAEPVPAPMTDYTWRRYFYRNSFDRDGQPFRAGARCRRLCYSRLRYFDFRCPGRRRRCRSSRRDRFMFRASRRRDVVGCVDPAEPSDYRGHWDAPVNTCALRDWSSRCSSKDGAAPTRCLPAVKRATLPATVLRATV